MLYGRLGIKLNLKVVIPPDGYLKSVRDLCSKYNVLMIANEVQSGLAQSGKMLACDWEEVRPNVVKEKGKEKAVVSCRELSQGSKKANICPTGTGVKAPST
ncbi:ornithine aminotransferase, mitochondrial-like isoform X2 [Quercus lobata]|uniref:ornithine aminotransferase, mitochondrial-like isoform X2 n=1 Tax=Quercus lobata TaxID=97700 RepID=UPI001247D00B|nr:ornithine aminotransferase, mitochondrial-like isoform X2 [Quercus lobata]